MHLENPVPGWDFDFAGEVLEIGKGCAGWNVGDRVAGFVHTSR